MGFGLGPFLGMLLLVSRLGFRTKKAFRNNEETKGGEDLGDEAFVLARRMVVSQQGKAGLSMEGQRSKH